MFAKGMRVRTTREVRESNHPKACVIPAGTAGVVFRVYPDDHQYPVTVIFDEPFGDIRDLCFDYEELEVAND